MGCDILVRSGVHPFMIVYFPVLLISNLVNPNRACGMLLLYSIILVTSKYMSFLPRMGTYTYCFMRGKCPSARVGNAERKSYIFASYEVLDGICVRERGYRCFCIQARGADNGEVPRREEGGNNIELSRPPFLLHEHGWNALFIKYRKLEWRSSSSAQERQGIRRHALFDLSMCWPAPEWCVNTSLRHVGQQYVPGIYLELSLQPYTRQRCSTAVKRKF